MYAAADFTWNTSQAPLPSRCFQVSCSSHSEQIPLISLDKTVNPSGLDIKPFVASVTLHNLLLVAHLNHWRGHYDDVIFIRQTSFFWRGTEQCARSPSSGRWIKTSELEILRKVGRLAELQALCGKLQSRLSWRDRDRIQAEWLEQIRAGGLGKKGGKK